MPDYAGSDVIRSADQLTFVNNKISIQNNLLNTANSRDYYDHVTFYMTIRKSWIDINMITPSNSAGIDYKFKEILKILITIFLTMHLLSLQDNIGNNIITDMLVGGRNGSHYALLFYPMNITESSDLIYHIEAEIALSRTWTRTWTQPEPESEPEPEPESQPEPEPENEPEPEPEPEAPEPEPEPEPETLFSVDIKSIIWIWIYWN